MPVHNGDETIQALRAQIAEYKAALDAAHTPVVGYNILGGVAGLEPPSLVNIVQQLQERVAVLQERVDRQEAELKMLHQSTDPVQMSRALAELMNYSGRG